MVVSRLEECGGAEACKTVCAARARNWKGGFDTALGGGQSHRENVALADNLRLMVRKLQAQRLAKMCSLCSQI